MVITPIENRSIANSIVIQNDEKIILAGSSKWNFNIARYNSDGSLDSTFGSDGIVITDIEGYYSEKCNAVVILEDGKILVGGVGQHFANDFSYTILVRYNEDGTLDNTFGDNGIVIGSLGIGNSLAVQSDGKIILGGTSDFSFALKRYNSNGTIDNSFGVDGEVITPSGGFSQGNSVVIQNDGKIILGGNSNIINTTHNFTLLRYNSDGSLDNTFGTNGQVTIPLENSSKGNEVLIQDDQKILFGWTCR